MSDRGLRDAERRWRETGRPEDRLRWWSQRARAGDLPEGAEALVEAATAGRLDPAAVELAAYLGDPRAHALALEEVAERVAYGDTERAMRVALDGVPSSVEDVLSWVRGLQAWDRRAFLLALAATVEHLAAQVAAAELDEVDEWITPEYREQEREHGLRAVREGAGAVRRWLDSPDDDARQALERAAHETYGWGAAAHAVGAAACAARAALALAAITPSGQWGRRFVAYDLGEALLAWEGAVHAAQPDPRALHAAVRDAVVPAVLRSAPHA